jgi:hypothetical protein
MVGLLASSVIGCQAFVGEVDTDVDAAGIGPEGGTVLQDGGRDTAAKGDSGHQGTHPDASHGGDAKGAHDSGHNGPGHDSGGGTKADGSSGSGDSGVSDTGTNDAPVMPQGDACSQNIEDCTNGIDDNCNGMVDCADPTCKSAGFTCVPTAPTGVDGPGRVR